MRILFAEDDRDLNEAVKTLLERSKYQVDKAADSLERISMHIIWSVSPSGFPFTVMSLGITA